ncbi:hypothetical protein TK90_1113 [Thioalkalivibrio sp. K90mix]|jgi:hypothetical protein|uniref:hypothetical protein n=1 Tax=Thioalkalivibrio sp. (strain K90mix) TaxID=396595 RepID=UPI000195A435|nr:hypothetical protein [Thioalkalivibrio sp. K90mix]ADC71624.1 hypothetical protein TK90_1113 [Thioalkalivibrio sp. K90mix]
MEPDTDANTDRLEPLEGLTLHPEFVRIEDGSRVVLLREDEFVQMIAALLQYEALRAHLGGDPLVDPD